MKIKDLEVGQKASLRLVLASAAVRQTKGNPPRDYLSATFTDGNDTLEGRIWNYVSNGPIPEAEKCYDITGSISEYMGKKQITLANMTVSDDQSTVEFQPCYTTDADAHYAEAMALIETMSPGILHGITKMIYTGLKAQIIASSSAKSVHHVGYGGNLVHSMQVARLADGVATTMCNYGLIINRDLLIAGALLHDIGKTAVYTADGAVIKYTRHGMEVDHIVLGIEMLDDYIKEGCPEYYNTDCVWALRHIIASHHGQLEYGSPVTPLFAEAYIVNYADGISASLDTLQSANNKALQEGKEYTDRLFTLNNREHILQKDVQ